MEFKQLRYFVSAARLMSFTKAAEDQYTSQSNISHQILNLEQELGVRLFERMRHQVRLTPSGELLFERAKEILANLDATCREVQETANAATGSLRIGFIAPATQPNLSHFLYCFRDKYPHVRIELTEGNWDSLNVGLESDEYDICFTMDMGARNTPGLKVRRLRNFPVVLISRKDDLAVISGEIDYENIRKRPFIYIKDQSCEQDIIALGKRRGFVPRIEYRVPNLTSVLTLVAAGCGLSIMPGFTSVADNSGMLQFTPIAGDDCYVTIAAAWKENRESPALQLLLSELSMHESLDSSWDCKEVYI